MAFTTWLGEVNPTWDVVPASVLFAERSEKSKSDDVHLTPSQKLGVLPQDEYVERTGAQVVRNRLGAGNMKHVEPGDFISHLRSFQGGLEFSALSGKVSNAYTVLSPRKTIVDRYYRYLFKSSLFVEGLGNLTDQLRDGQTINFARLAQFGLPLPDLETQRAIADYLDRETAEIDAMMADLEKMETLLTERRDATVEKLLLGGGTPELEGLPEGWTRTTLGTVFSFHNGDRGVHYPRPEEIKDEGIPFINAGDLINGSVDLEGCKRVSPEKYAQMGGAKLQRGDILFCLRGSLGKWGLMESDGGSLASSLCALRNERTDLVDVRYIAHAMSTRVISLQIWFNESGSAQPNLGAEQVARFRVPLPPLEEQHRIVDVIDRETAEIDAMLADITELRDLLAERRAALIAAAVTGQIDIPAAEETTHA